MSKRLTPLSFRQVREILMNNGFRYLHTRGSHYIYTNQFERVVVVPYKKTMPVGTLKKIMAQSGLSREKFLLK